ncbi:unnamed protein product [Caretta caretta]
MKKSLLELPSPIPGLVGVPLARNGKEVKNRKNSPLLPPGLRRWATAVPLESHTQLWTFQGGMMPIRLIPTTATWLLPPAIPIPS